MTEKLTYPKRNCKSGKGNIGTLRISVSRFKMTHFIKLTVIRKIAFRHKTEEFSVLNSRGAVKQLSADLYRKPDKNKRRNTFAGFYYFNERTFRSFKQTILRKQIRTAITGNTKLRKNNYRRTLLLCLFHKQYNLLCVKSTVRDSKLRSRCRNLYKSILHCISHAFRIYSDFVRSQLRRCDTPTDRQDSKPYSESIL